MDPERRILDADVVVEGGRIQSVEKTPREKRRSGGKKHPRADTLDCRGLVIMPGLVQAHIHLCQTLFRGLADDQRLAQVDVSQTLFRGLADDLPLEAWLANRIWPL